MLAASRTRHCCSPAVPSVSLFHHQLPDQLLKPAKLPQQKPPGGEPGGGLDISALGPGRTIHKPAQQHSGDQFLQPAPPPSCCPRGSFASQLK